MPPRAADDNPPPKEPTEPSPPVGHTHDDSTCCCDSISLILTSLSVDRETSAPDLPWPLSDLVGYLTDDRASVTCIPECGDRKPMRWPRELPFETVPKDHPVTPLAPMATIYPDANCQVNCDLRIDALRVSRADDAIKALTGLLDKLTEALDAVVGLQSGKAILKAFGTDVDKIEKEIKDLWAQVADALAKLKEDNLMGEFFIRFHGDLGCNGDALFAALAGRDPTAKPTQGDSDSIEYTRILEKFKGQWTLKFRAERNCKKERKP